MRFSAAMRRQGIMHPLRCASKEERGYLDLLQYFLIHMESYSVERGKGVSKTANLALSNECMTPKSF